MITLTPMPDDVNTVKDYEMTLQLAAAAVMRCKAYVDRDDTHVNYKAVYDLKDAETLIHRAIDRMVSS